jgi:hypothetical protein
MRYKKETSDALYDWHDSRNSPPSIFLIGAFPAFFMCLALQIRASFSKKQTPHLQVTWDEPLYGPARAGDVDSRRGWGREKAGTLLLQAFYRCVANL